ncbi:hypothetical protein [Pseudomonas sp. Irchel 3E19]|uniref:hypothetical protein n=1 Tax=Pseudomonas sp. Irchel 3E19 TaxID=2008981 RepID=UPI00114080A1|nr:hypothetical protein [Pseudomonas sp. Irchel 3E19]
MMDQENERMILWMREIYNIPDDVDVDEDYPGYEDMAEVYQHEQEMAEYEAQIKWFEEHPFLETYSIFTENLKALKIMVNQRANPFDDKTIHKMVYAHAVTLLEAMIGDVIKSAILTFPHLMNIFVENLSEDKGLKYTVKEIAELGLNGIVINILNSLSYHNPIVVKKYVNLVTGRVLPDTHMANIKKVVEMRHDFIHRNGKTIMGEYHNIDTPMVIESIGVIEQFAADVFDTLSKAMSEE